MEAPGSQFVESGGAMVDKAESGEHEDDAQDKPPESPGDEVAPSSEPAGIIQQKDTEVEQYVPGEECQPVVPPRRKPPRDWVDYTTLGLAAAVIFIYGWQACSLSRQVSSLERQTSALRSSVALMRSQQRAWVGPMGVSNPDIKEGSQYLAEVILTNSGQSPALRVGVVATYNVQPPNEEFEPLYRETEPIPASRFTVHPNSWPSIPISVDPECPVTGEWAKAIIEDQTMILYVYGIITYEDIFGDDPLTTTFGFRYQPALGTWRYTDTYNTAD
jgi:hypothetical protein